MPRPTAGHAIEKVLTPERVQVILGQVSVKDGPKPPSLAGYAIVTQLGEDDSRIPLAKVDVTDDGRVLVRRTGAGRYELELHLDFFPGTTTLTVLGGATFEVTPAKPALWVTLHHAGTDLTGRAAHVSLHASGEERTAAGVVRLGKDESALALPGAGSYRIQLTVGGTNALPPLEAATNVDLVSGTASVTAAFKEVPHGTVIVRIPQAVFDKARGATVVLSGLPTARTATLIPGLAESATFEHVRADSMQVRVEWDEEGRENTGMPLSVAPGKTTTVIVEDDRP